MTIASLVHNILAEEFSLSDYSVVRAELWGNVHDAVLEAISKDDTRGFSDKMKKYIRDAAVVIILLAWSDGGGTGDELDDVANTFYEGWLENQMNATDQLPKTIKSFAANPDTNISDFAFASARADGYCMGLDGLFGLIKVSAAVANNTMLTLVGQDGKQSCADCQFYKYQRHSAKWWVENKLVPYPGNENYECGNWENCHHYLVSDDGKQFTL